MYTIYGCHEMKAILSDQRKRLKNIGKVENRLNERKEIIAYFPLCMKGTNF